MNKEDLSPSQLAKLEGMLAESARQAVLDDHGMTIGRWRSLAEHSANRDNHVAEDIFRNYVAALEAFEFPWKKVTALDA